MGTPRLRWIPPEQRAYRNVAQVEFGSKSHNPIRGLSGTKRHRHEASEPFGNPTYASCGTSVILGGGLLSA